MTNRRYPWYHYVVAWIGLITAVCTFTWMAFSAARDGRWVLFSILVPVVVFYVLFTAAVAASELEERRKIYE